MGDQTVLQPRQFSDAEWQVRCDLAACYRAFVRYGWTDLIYTHISARHPARADWYLINPYGLLFDEIMASNLIVVDLEGEQICGDYPYNAAGHAIHSAVLRARTDVNWVLHTHTRAGMAVSCMRCGLIPVTQQAMFLHGQVAYHPWDVQTAGPEECQRLVADLGDKNAMILQNHGLLTCAATIGEAFTKLYILETACKVQVDLMRSQVELVIPDDEIIERTAAHGATALTGEREWEAIRRSIERTDPSYRD
ncbi:MAG: class II aldolase/adducin family protein [Acidiferrobacterales bacterium]